MAHTRLFSARPQSALSSKEFKEIHNTYLQSCSEIKRNVKAQQAERSHVVLKGKAAAMMEKSGEASVSEIKYYTELRGGKVPRNGAVTLTALSRQIEFKEIISFYPELKPQDKLYQNLRHALNLINFFRGFIKYSSSHTDSNLLTLQHRYILNAIVFSYEDLIKRKDLDFSQKLLMNFYFMQQMQVANCDEIVYGAWLESQVQCPEINAEVYACGRHVVLMLDRPLSCSATHYSRWPREVVVCDIWAGTAFSAADIPKRLLDYDFEIGNLANLVYSHEQSPVLELDFPGVQIDSNSLKIMLQKYQEIKKILATPSPQPQESLLQELGFYAIDKEQEKEEAGVVRSAQSFHLSSN